jgi:dynein heavy chain
MDTDVRRRDQAALTRLREVEHSSDAAYQAVALTAFNPKTVTLGGLYGEYHPQTHEWQDGLASCLIRAAVADASPAYKWIAFDGPIDCGWIENLNTVRPEEDLPPLKRL